MSPSTLVCDQPCRARGDLQALERHLVGVRIAAARACKHPHAHSLVEGAGRMLDHALLQAGRLDDAKLEVEVGVVGVPGEGSAEDALEARIREAEALAEEPLDARDLHRHESSKRSPEAPPLSEAPPQTGEAESGTSERPSG